jgi:hypothetical protein
LRSGGNASVYTRAVLLPFYITTSRSFAPLLPKIIRKRKSGRSDTVRSMGLKYFLYEYELHLAEEQGQPVRRPGTILRERGSRPPSSTYCRRPPTRGTGPHASIRGRAGSIPTTSATSASPTATPPTVTSPSQRRSKRTILINEVTRIPTSCRSEGSPSSRIGTEVH